MAGKKTKAELAAELAETQAQQQHRLERLGRLVEHATHVKGTVLTLDQVVGGPAYEIFTVAQQILNAAEPPTGKPTAPLPPVVVHDIKKVRAATKNAATRHLHITGLMKGVFKLTEGLSSDYSRLGGFSSRIQPPFTQRVLDVFADSEQYFLTAARIQTSRELMDEMEHEGGGRDNSKWDYEALYDWMRNTKLPDIQRQIVRLASHCGGSTSGTKNLAEQMHLRALTRLLDMFQGWGY